MKLRYIFVGLTIFILGVSFLASSNKEAIKRCEEKHIHEVCINALR